MRREESNSDNKNYGVIDKGTFLAFDNNEHSAKGAKWEKDQWEKP